MAENRGHAPQRDGPADPDSSRSRSSNGLFSIGRRVRDCTGDLLHVGQALYLAELRDEKVAADPGDAPGTAGSEPAALLLRQSAIESSWSRWKELHLRCRSLDDAFTARCIAALPHLDTKWEHGSDLHRQPSPYEGDTLLVELPCCEVVGAMGFSPMTCRVRTGCSKTLSYTPKESGGGERYCPAPGITPGPV